MTSKTNTYTLESILSLESDLHKPLTANFDTIQKELLRICRYGDFTQTDMDKLQQQHKRKIFSRLVDYYFGIEIPTVEAKKQGRKILISDTGQNKSLVTIDLNNLPQELNVKDIVKRVIQYKIDINKGQKQSFTSFRQREKNRWKSILECFNLPDKEHILISLYLTIISTIAAKEISTDSTIKPSFGIDVFHETNLQKLLYKLTDKINFIHIPVMNKENKLHKEKVAGIITAAKIMTAGDYHQINSVIYFGCPTTIVCYILDLINKKMSSDNSLNGYSIERSQKMKISPSKLKSDQQRLKDFELLTRDNYAQTLSRAKKYLKDPNTIESKLFRQIKPILKEHILL